MHKALWATRLVVVVVIVVLIKLTAYESQDPRPVPTTAVVPTATPAGSMLPRVGLMCTGSMEPALTCLDLMVAQPVFTAADITVDSIIRVSSCGARFTHRVVAIRNVRERRYYQTKGDAHPEPDNCWIPHHDVYGLIVDIERNAVPQNSALRDGVNAAKALILANPESTEGGPWGQPLKKREGAP